MNIRKDYWWHWVPFKQVPGQEAYAGFWIDMLDTKNCVPCTFTGNDLRKNPDVRKLVKKIGREVLEEAAAKRAKR